MRKDWELQILDEVFRTFPNLFRRRSALAERDRDWAWRLIIRHSTREQDGRYRDEVERGPKECPRSYWICTILDHTRHRNLFCRVLRLLVMVMFCVNEAVLSIFIWCFVVVKNLCSGNCSYFQAKFLDCWSWMTCCLLFLFSCCLFHRFRHYYSKWWVNWVIKIVEL